MTGLPCLGPHPLSGTVRFGRPLGCGRHPDENPGTEAAAERFVVALDPDLFKAALTAHANARTEVFRVRAEKTITDHIAEAHPGR